MLDDLRTLSAAALMAATLCLLASPAPAGDLEPPGPPAPTMKSLDEVSGAWFRRFDSTNGDGAGCDSDRFKCDRTFSSHTVLDMETGLVWERIPTASAFAYPLAIDFCLRKEVAGRHGWRLPAAAELLTLRDETQAAPHLPAGHPFLGIGATDIFWTANSLTLYNGATMTTDAFVVAMGGPAPGTAYHVNSVDILSGNYRYWCVRGPSPAHGFSH